MSYYISNGLIFAYLVLFMCFNMKSKINKIAAFFAVFVPFAAFGLTQKIVTTSPVIHVAITWAIFIVLACLVFDEQLKTKFIIILVALIINYATSSLATIVTIFLSEDLQMVNFRIVVPYHILTIALLVLFTVFRKKIKISKHNLIVFSVIGITQLIFAEVAILFMIYGGNPFSPNPPTLQSDNSNSFALVVIAVASLFYVVSDIVLFVMMKKLSQSEKIKEELRFREYKNQMNFDYYKSVEKNAEETRKLRHDMANILQVAGSLVEGDNRDKETSKQILSQIRKEISEIRLEKYTENSLVNAIVSNKAAVCREKGISYDFDIRIPEEIGIEEIDICKVYVNIIDNAINAVLSLPNEKKNIEIKSFVETGNLYISSKNYCSEEKTKEKKPSSEHGYGQKILAGIAEKYNGKFITDCEKNIYTALLVAKV